MHTSLLAANSPLTALLLVAVARVGAAGWRYNGQGECTKMPSTTLCRGVQGKQAQGGCLCLPVSLHRLCTQSGWTLA